MGRSPVLAISNSISRRPSFAITGLSANLYSPGIIGCLPLPLLAKKLLTRHSERSDESFLLWRYTEERFLAPLGMASRECFLRRAKPSQRGLANRMVHRYQFRAVGKSSFNLHFFHHFRHAFHHIFALQNCRAIFHEFRYGAAIADSFKKLRCD